MYYKIIGYRRAIGDGATEESEERKESFFEARETFRLS
jgi:hypothetical protein